MGLRNWLRVWVMAGMLGAAPTWAERILVSPTGNDQADGIAQPVRSLTAALALARKIRTNGAVSVEIILTDGYYELTKSVTLAKTDSGTAAHPLVIRAAEGASPVLSGGIKAHAGKKLDSKEAMALPSQARVHVRVIELERLGLRDGANLRMRGFGMGGTAPLEVFSGNKRLRMAQFPNDGWLRIDQRVKAVNERTYTTKSDRLNNWTNAKQPWAYGYWYHDWADHLVPVEAIDPKTKQITLKKMHSYGLRAGARFRMVHLIEELDTPGEWFLDGETNRLYLWPKNDKAMLITHLKTPLLQLKDAKHIQLKSLTFEGGRSSLLSITNCSEVTVSGCTLRKGGSDGVTIRGGADNRVESCHLHNLGSTGVQLNGGDRKTLQSANHIASNNHIHHFGETQRTYAPAIRLNGVGNSALHNHIHHAPHMAVGYGGNNHRIAFNDVHHVLLDTDDAGAFYIGRDWTARGHILEWNYIHHSGPQHAGDSASPTHRHGTNLIYHDDLASGITTRHNILHDGNRGFLVGGGRDNLVESNILIGGKIGIWVDARGLGWAKGRVPPGGDWKMYAKLKAMKHDQAPYRTAYPKLATMLDNNPHAPIGTTVRGNILINVPTDIKLQTATPAMLTIENNKPQSTEISEAWLLDGNRLLKELNLPLPPEPIGILGSTATAN